MIHAPSSSVFQRVVIALAAVAVAGCAADVPRSAPADGSPTASVSIPIGPDGPELREDVVAELQTYGTRHADEFAGLYVEDQASGAFVMLFTDRLEEHAAALNEIWPRVTVRPARYTEAELLAVLEGLDLAGLQSDSVEPIGAGLDTINNRITLEVKTSDPTLELRLEMEHGGRLDVTAFPLPGPWENVAAGDGWRLLAAGRADHDDAYVVRAATDPDAWDELWAGLGLDAEQPRVALADEIVVTFGHGIGSGCPEVRLDAVAIRDGVVFSETSDPLAPRACTADLAGAAVFVVAIDRAALPPGGFTLQLAADRITGGGSTEVLDVPLP